MRVFVTGASGFIGSAVVRELIAHGHQVRGLARSDASAAALEQMGAGVQRGQLTDHDSLRAGAREADAVIHLAFIHDFTKTTFAESSAVDERAIGALGEALVGTNRPLLIASGMLGLEAPAGQLVTEETQWDLANPSSPRLAGVTTALALAERGVRPVIVRFPPSVHGRGDHGFVHTLIEIARQRGVSAYVGDGANRWPAVHRLDAASALRLALDKAPARASLQPIADEGVSLAQIAEIIGRHLKLPVQSIAKEEAPRHFTWMAHFLGIDAPASSVITQRLLGWTPTQPGLVADLEEGHYFANA